MQGDRGGEGKGLTMGSGKADDDAGGHGAAHAGVTRRGFVAGSVGAAALLALGGAAAVAPADALVRPPGAQDEDLFLGACIRCDRCMSVCPERAIVLAKLEDGLLAARTPKMGFRAGYCTMCEGGYLCAQVCPTGAIRVGFDDMRDKMGMAVVDYAECLLYRGVSGACSKQCVAACPYGALAYSDAGGLVVDEGKCNGCGACELACPSASYGGSTGNSHRGINVSVWSA